ncbi:MAG: transporter permease [Microbacteriaceae bacterium]|nr:transporter permease [Microbacteriaceae bacterium]
MPGTNEGVAEGSNTEPSASLYQTVSQFGYSAAGTALATPQRGPRRPRWLSVLLGALLPIALVVAWQVISASGLVPAYRLPTPISVWQAAIDLAQRGLLFTDIGISTQRVLLGFAFGAIAGLIVGSVIGLSRWASLVLSPTLGGFRAVPSLAWVPLLILYLGINEDSKVILITIGAFFPVFTTLYLGLRHVDRNLVEAARAFGLNGIRLLTTVQLPAVVPALFSGLRLALAQSWLFLVAAELIASSMGLGFLLIDSQNNGRVDRMLLTIVLLALLGKTTDALLGLAERWLGKRWR